MDFFINHIGWFVGLFFIILFAIVGYFVDKKEHENNSKKVDNNVSNDSNDVSDIYAIKNDNNQEVVVQENVQPFVQGSVESSVQEGVVQENISSPVMGGVDSIEGFYDGLDVESEGSSEPVDYSINVDGSNDFNTEGTDLEWSGSDKKEETDDSMSFESINMTFEDLERKNVDIINDSLGVTDSEDGFISDYNDDDIDFYEDEPESNSTVIVENAQQENNVEQVENVQLQNGLEQAENVQQENVFEQVDSSISESDVNDYASRIFDTAIESNQDIGSDVVNNTEGVAVDSGVESNAISNDEENEDEIWNL